MGEKAATTPGRQLLESTRALHAWGVRRPNVIEFETSLELVLLSNVLPAEDSCLLPNLGGI